MTDQERKACILIADPQSDLLTTAPLVPDDTTPFPLHSRTLRDCQRRISNREISLIGAFINPEIGHPAWMTVVKDTHTYHPNCPVFLVCSREPKLSQKDLADLAITKVLKKPLDFKQLLQELKVAPVTVTEPTEGSAPQSRPEGPGDAEYLAIKALSLVSRLPLQFDVFLRLSAGHYARLWKAGDVIDRAQFDRQLQKGVQDYFVKKADQEHWLKTCDALIQKVLDDPEVPIEVKADEVLAAGVDTLDLLRHQGMTHEAAQHAVAFAVTAQKAVSELVRHHALLQKFLFDTAIQDHAIATTMLGAVMLNHIKMPAGDNFNKLNMALMLHDAGLWNAPKACREEDESKMSEEEIKIYHDHPALSAKILAEAGQFPAPLLEAVAQYHMRLGKKGFPARQGVAKLNSIAEMIGICCDFARLIKNTPPEQHGAALANMQRTVKEAFSPSIVAAFDRAFFWMA